MKLTDIDDWDHFKGDFKSRPKKEETNIFRDLVDAQRYLSINSSYVMFGGNLKKLQHGYNKLYMSIICDPSKAPELRGMSFDEVIECDHDPIDVGFAKVKMVCRKCDKDL